MRHAPDASEATRAVLAHLHGPVYAMDRKPHLAQVCSVAAQDADPARVAAMIFAEVLDSLKLVTVKWTGAPARMHWQRERPPVVKTPGWYPRVSLPKTFPCTSASVVWCGETGLAGKTLCVEFALTEAQGRITGFSYRYDLVGTSYEIAVAEAPNTARGPGPGPQSAVSHHTPVDSHPPQTNS